MRIFVASWFFPPVTTSEGIVAYKLFRNSEHHYDVCSSLSKQWTYNQEFPFDADNITVYPVDTDDFSIWVDEAVRIFEEQHALHPYDAYMTRTMPPESINFAKRMVELHPEVPWIASLADPIAKSPYEIKAYILDNDLLPQRDKDGFLHALHYGIGAWRNYWNPSVRLMCENKDLEDFVVSKADAIIMPHDTMRSYVLDNRPRSNTFIVPHSFDTTLYPEVTKESQDRVTLSYLGYSDTYRSLEPVVRALAHLQKVNQAALDRLQVRFVGNVPDTIRTSVFSNFLHNTISIEPSVGYIDSLGIMEQSDWLIHIDAKFDFLPETGGSVYFAGKLADYLGTSHPILAISGEGSPAADIVSNAGGLVFDPSDITGLAQALGEIAMGRDTTEVDVNYRETYDAVQVAANYDQMINHLLAPERSSFTRPFWPQVTPSDEPKVLTVCVPAYNVECYLDRCLYSMISSDVANRLEILVVNDGSPDNSREIALAYQEHYPSIVRLIDKENGGHGSTINVALAQASGTYFRVLDGDDWFDTDALSKLLRGMEKHKIDADVVSTNYLQVYAGSGDTVPWAKKGTWPDYEPLDFNHGDFSQEYFTMASVMVKTEVLRQAHFKLQEHTYYVDVEYLLFFIPYVSTVVFTPEYLYRYTVGNAEQSINPDVIVRRYAHHDRVIRRMVNYFAKRRASMSPGQIGYVDSLFVRHILKSQYELSLIMDPNKKRGCQRAKDFDAFLAHTAPSLHQAMGKKYRAIRQARSSRFSPRKAKYFRTLESGTWPVGMKTRLIGWAKGFIIRRASVVLRVVNVTETGRRFLESDTARNLRTRLMP